MKSVKNILAVMMILMGATAMGYERGSYGVDGDFLLACFGSMELRQNVGGKLAIKFGSTISRSCDQVRFVDASTNRIIKTYKENDLAGQTYTLSDDQAESLSDDCALRVQVLNAYSGVVLANRYIVINNCRPTRTYKRQNNNQSGYYYEWSQKHNCKLMKNGEFIKLVSDSYCY